MSKTVSFVAKDELAEWLERRAEERMKSISAVCQDIVAAEYRRENEVDTAKSGDSGSEGESVDLLDRYPDVWYHPKSSKYDYAVDHPEKPQKKYYKTRDGAASRIERWYDSEV